MEYEDFLVRFSIWVALIAYAAAVFLGSRNGLENARLAWTIGCIAYLLHVYFAFEFHHAWNHQQAYSETRERTFETTGLSSGIGLYVNYLFTLIWTLDVIFWWWKGTKTYVRRSKWISFAMHAFFVFMIFNGAVVFAQGPARWIGILVLTISTISYFSTNSDRAKTQL